MEEYFLVAKVEVNDAKIRLCHLTQHMVHTGLEYSSVFKVHGT